MDCSTFRRLHLAYLDDTLCADLLVAAECHVIECPACARHDTAVRRALLLARNLPAIEPSADFTERLHERLRAIERGERAAPPAPPMDWAPTWRELAAARVRTQMAGVSGRLPSRRRMAVAASVVAMLSAGALGDWERGPTAAAADPAAALATRGDSLAGRGGDVSAAGDPFGTPGPGEPRFERLPAAELVGPVTAGVPVFPAALLAGEAPVELMGIQGAAGFELVSFGQ